MSRIEKHNKDDEVVFKKNTVGFEQVKRKVVNLKFCFFFERIPFKCAVY